MFSPLLSALGSSMKLCAGGIWVRRGQEWVTEEAGGWKAKKVEIGTRHLLKMDQGDARN